MSIVQNCLAPICRDILGSLTKLQNTLKCPICNNKCVNPVRIKICGHYFCSKCLKSSKETHICPKCNEVYDSKNLDYENIAKETEQELSELRKLLECVQSTITKPPSNTKDSSLHENISPKLGRNIIVYDNNEYHINFVETVSKINAKGETPLHLACKKNKFEEVKALIEAKADINAKDYAGWAPLHEAVQGRNLEIIEYLLKQKCLIDIPGSDYTTPLHQAASLDNIDIVRLLLRYRADKNMVDYNGLKPRDYTENVSIKSLLKKHPETNSERKFFELFLPGKVVLYCHSIDDCIRKKLEACKNIQVVDKMNVKRNLTHFMIKKTHKMSFKIMQAMLEGQQFLTEDCVDDYIKGNYFINIPDHIFLTNNAALNQGIRKAMLSALLKLPKLFDGIHFYIEDHQTPISIYNLKVDKEYLSKLIKTGGGKVLFRPPATRTCETVYSHPFFSVKNSSTYRCCNFIIFAESKAPDLLYNMPELQHKSSKWLIDCVVHYEIID